MLKKLFGGKKKKLASEDVEYSEARDALERGHVRDQKALAGNQSADPEVLYYLATSDSKDVRALVAANPTTPRQADLILADDSDDDVRADLARKIGRLIPGLSEIDTVKIRELTISVLEKLAEDQVPRIRQIIAEEIKETDLAPRDVVLKLARDVELAVCGPILEYSPLLSDDDLREIISSGQVQGAIECIAKRSSVNEEVADSIVASLDVPAVAALLSNGNAQIREETLDLIVENAEQVDQWHRPLAMRPELSLRALRRIAGFVAFAILEEVSMRNDLDSETETYLKQRVRDRIEQEEGLEEGLEDNAASAFEIVAQAAQEGRLDVEFFSEAVEDNQRELVVAGLAHLTGKPSGFINRVLSSRSGKAVTALTWKANLPVRTALMIQMQVAKVPPKNQVMARNGSEYALTSDEMDWQLEYFDRSA